MIRIRTNERFTYPAEFKSLILQNMDIIRPYFHKNIRFYGEYMLCSLSADSVRINERLSELVENLMPLLENKAFEALCFVSKEKSDTLMKKGLEPEESIRFFMPFTVPGTKNEAAAVKCIIRFRDFSEESRIPFVIELIKSISYYVLERYDYRFSFEGRCIHKITAKRIVEIIK